MGIEVLYDGKGPEGTLRPTVDIVAIHGLNPTNKEDHAFATWTDSESGHLWLRDSLPRSQPTARVLLYSYNSSPVFGNDQDRFIYGANAFLECLRDNRREDPHLPLIMVGHSLGGILIKQALINGHNNPKYKDIKQATFGLVFFGTPHAGPANDFKVKFGKACVKIAQSMPWKVPNDIMEALKKRSLFSEVLSEHWRHQLEQYQIISFYEGVGNVVPRHSAVLGLDGMRENQVKLDATHSDMCRFNRSVKKDVDNYALVEGNLRDLCSICSTKYVNEAQLEDLLDSLRVWSDNPRMENVVDQHENSLQWIWNASEDGPGFVKWLKSNVPIYWISGLPGSGKSTLMKYLYESSQTQNYMSTNSQSGTVIAYFFHELGMKREIRFKSLLACIVESLLTSFSTLASLYLTQFMELKRSKRGPEKFRWHERYLKKWLQLIGQSNAVGNVLLFVDGFDECSGDHREQLQFLVSWIKSMQGEPFTVRMCLSSRPLPEIGLRLSPFPECKIHEWTANDISAYVREKLCHVVKTPAFYDLEPHTHHKRTIVDRLAEKVIGKAQGVFLWVEIVVNNLIGGLEEGSNDSELMNSVDSLPRELEKLYARIFEQIPKDYIDDAKMYFRLALSRHPLGLLDFYLATRDQREVLSKRDRSSYEHHLTVKHACSRAETRINSRCRGLLQVKQGKKDVSSFHYTSSKTNNTTPLASELGKNVEFLHLSVRDYIASKPFAASLSFGLRADVAFMVSSVGLLKLMQPSQILRLQAWDDMAFDLTSEFSALMKYTEEDDLGQSQLSGFGPIETFLLHARDPSNSPELHQTHLLVELDRVCSLANQNWRSIYLESALENDERGVPVGLNPNHVNTDLFCLCLAYGLDAYVKAEIEVNAYEVEDRVGRPLLHFFFDLCYTRCALPDLETLRLLLRHGAKPNEIFEGKTSWEYALHAIQFLVFKRIETPQGWTEPLTILLEHGAIPNQSAAGSDSALMVICQVVDRDTWVIDGTKALIKAVILSGGKMEQDELEWVESCCSLAIRRYIERTQDS